MRQANQSIEFRMDEKALDQWMQFQEEYRSYIPDAFSDEFLPDRLKDPEEVPDEETPPEQVSEEYQKHLLTEATKMLASGEVYQQQTPEQGLAEKAFLGESDVFGGASMDLSEESSKVMEEVMDARKRGYGNLDIVQEMKFFIGDEKWRTSGPENG